MLFALLFFDVWTPDDFLPDGQGVGMRIGRDPIEEVTAYAGGEYELHPLFEEPVTRVRPALPPGGLVKRYQSVTVAVKDDGERLIGVVQPDPVDLEAMGIDALDEGGEPTIEGAPVEAPADEIVLESLAPFPVRVDVRNSRLISTAVPLSPRDFPVIAGMAVRTPDGDGTALQSQSGIVLIRSDEKRTVATRLPNPNDLEVPLILVLAALAWGAVTLRAALHRFD